MYVTVILAADVKFVLHAPREQRGGRGISTVCILKRWNTSRWKRPWNQAGQPVLDLEKGLSV